MIEWICSVDGPLLIFLYLDESGSRSIACTLNQPWVVVVSNLGTHEIASSCTVKTLDELSNPFC